MEHEFIFGTVERNGELVLNLKTVGDTHTNLSGFQQTVREYPDRIITDTFTVKEKYHSADGPDGKAYDWYVIDKHYRDSDNFTPEKENIRQRNEAAEIVFVALAESGTIDDVTAGEHAALFEEWQAQVDYSVGNIRRHGDKLYRCVQAHTSQEGWEPEATPALWACTADPAEEWPEWSQPIGATDAYPRDAKVSHSGRHWTSSVDNNVWEPGVYGWTEA